MEINEIREKWEKGIDLFSMASVSPNLKESTRLLSKHKADQLRSCLEDIKQLSIASSDRCALKELIDFEIWRRNSSPMMTSETAERVVNKYIKSINIGEQGD
jgi:hypothetical protein